MSLALSLLIVEILRPDEIVFSNTWKIESSQAASKEWSSESLHNRDMESAIFSFPARYMTLNLKACRRFSHLSILAGGFEVGLKILSKGLWSVTSSNSNPAR